MLGEHLGTGAFVFIIGWVLAIWSIIHIAQSNSSPLGKAIWIVVVLCLPVIGFIVWLLFGPRSAKARS